LNYLNAEKNGLDLYQRIDRFVKQYNCRKNQGIGRKKPANLYLNAA